ncbi:MAG: LTA synthase family protein [Bacteroidia bacterium]
MKKTGFYLYCGVLLLLMFTIYRFAFFELNNHELIKAAPTVALLTGLRFDIAVVCYWLLPLYALHILTHFTSRKMLLTAFAVFEHIWLLLGAVFMTLTAVANIGNYKYYYAPIGLSILNWSDNATEVGGMLWEDNLFKQLFFAVVLFITVYGIVYVFMYRKQGGTEGKPTKYDWIGLILLLLGARGGLQHSLKAEDVNWGQNTFFNQVALNPIFHLTRNITSDADAFVPMSENEYTAYNAAWAAQFAEKQTDSQTVLKNANVVLIFMESFSAHQLPYSPFFDSLSQEGIYFPQFYSAGEHTYNGIFSSHFGAPSSQGRHMLRWLQQAKIEGISDVLKRHGYYNAIHIPHSRSFDHMSGFFWRHHYDAITDVSCMPDSLKNPGVWGTDDGKNFQFAAQLLDQIAQKKKPFFFSTLTISNHVPWLIPKEFKLGYSKNIADRAANYADASLRAFFKTISKKPYFKNTLFIILGDHGMHQETNDYPLPLSLHQVPFLLYAPAMLSKEKPHPGFAQQEDIKPTLLALLGIQDTQTHAFGINLLTHARLYATFCSDAWFGIRNKQSYTIMNRFGETHTYTLGENTENPNQDTALAAILRQHTRYTESYFNNLKYNKKLP